MKLRGRALRRRERAGRAEPRPGLAEGEKKKPRAPFGPPTRHVVEEAELDDVHAELRILDDPQSVDDFFAGGHDLDSSGRRNVGYACTQRQRKCGFGSRYSLVVAAVVETAQSPRAMLEHAVEQVGSEDVAGSLALVARKLPLAASVEA